MTMKHWSFRCRKSAFDGARLTSEAQKAGLSVVTVSAGSVSVTLATSGFLDRLRKHGLLGPGTWAEQDEGWEFCDECRLSARPVTGRDPRLRYRARSLLPASEIEALVTSLERAEATPVRYAVRGWE